MTVNKDFKRLVRARMRKTGESYTAARVQLLAVKQPVDYARLARFSDATLKQRTGCDWDRWVKALDRAGAAAWPHDKIARYVHEKYKVGDWWSQNVTVGYERIKGLRAVGQRRGGSWETSKSRVYPVAIARLYRAWSDAKTRGRWLGGADYVMRSTTRNKYVRMKWGDGSTVAVGFLAKGRAKAQVAVQHEQLPDAATQTRMKQFWTERLDALGDVLA